MASIDLRTTGPYDVFCFQRRKFSYVLKMMLKQYFRQSQRHDEYNDLAANNFKDVI